MASRHSSQSENTLVQMPSCPPQGPYGSQASFPHPTSVEEGLCGPPPPQPPRPTSSLIDEKKPQCTSAPSSSDSSLICSPWQPWKRRRGWAEWASDSVKTPALVPCLVVQAFATGILDATTYADFLTFASNQTGNTILLCVAAIGTTTHSKIALLLTGVSFAAFLAGALVFGHLGHYMGRRKRLWIITSTIYQIITLVVAAILLSPAGPAKTNLGGKHEWVPLLLFANMSGAQVAQARQSGSQELPTAPMTSSYVDLMADQYLFVGFRHPKAGPRNRRLLYLLSMIAGGFLGAAVHRFAASWPVVTITIFLKVVVIGMMCVAKEE